MCGDDLSMWWICGWQILWGRLHIAEATSVTYTHTADFLTSTFGGLLPAGLALPVVELSSQVTGEESSAGCAPLPTAVNVTGAAVLVARGGCRFDEKTLFIQEAGAALVVVYDPQDRALQRLGGSHPTQGYLRIPAVMVSMSFIEAYREATGAGRAVTITLSPEMSPSGADKWIDVAHTEWAEGVEDQLLQLEGMVQKYGRPGDMPDIERWLRRRVQRLRAEDKSEL